jgi:hypothetical protein
MGRTRPVAHHGGGSGGRGHRRDLHLAAAVCSQISTRRLAMASMYENNDVGTQYRLWMAKTQSAPTLVRAAVVHDCTVEHDPGRDEPIVEGDWSLQRLGLRHRWCQGRCRAWPAGTR